MAATPKSLTGLVPFLKPYRLALLVAALFLLLAAGTTLAFPWVLRQLIDQGLSTGASAEQLSGNFLQLFGVAAALAVFSAGRYYTVSWLGERVVADIRLKVQQNLLRLSPGFYEVNSPKEISSRMTSDTAVIENVVGTTVSVALRNLLILLGGLVFLLF